MNIMYIYILDRCEELRYSHCLNCIRWPIYRHIEIKLYFFIFYSMKNTYLSIRRLKSFEKKKDLKALKNAITFVYSYMYIFEF